MQDPAQAESYRKLGVNLYLGLWQGPTDPQLSQLEAAGMLTICAQNEVGLRHRDDRAIAGWFLDEGPDNAKDGKRRRDPADLATQYRATVAADPSRPAYCNFGPGVPVADWIGRGQDIGHAEMYPRYLVATDIASFDLYPVADAADIPQTQGQLWRIADGIDRLGAWGRQADRQHGRPAWCIIECGQIRDGGPRPTREEVRAEAWMAIVHGASGICWFCHHFGPGDQVDPAGLLHDAESSATVAAIDAEIAAQARFLDLVSASGTTASAEAGVPIDVLAKPSGRGRFIATVAMREQTARATIRLPWPATIEVVGESRRIDAHAGSFQDSFAPYGVHLYQATPIGR